MVDFPDENKPSAPPKQLWLGRFFTIVDRHNFWIPGFILLVFFGAFFWAKAKDRYHRIWFTVGASNSQKVKGVAVLPKPVRPRPVVFLFHGSGESRSSSGTMLRQLAEVGLAGVSFDYDQSDIQTLSAQFEAIHGYVMRQSWAETNAIAFVGFGRGAEMALALASARPDLQPNIMVVSGAGWTSELKRDYRTSKHPLIRSRIWFVHGERDAVVSLSEATRLVGFFRTNAVLAELMVLPGQQHDFEPNRMLLLRVIGEKCMQEFVGRGDVSRLWFPTTRTKAATTILFWIPAIVWVCMFIYHTCQRLLTPRRDARLSGWERGLRWMTGFMVALAVEQWTMHLVLPRFKTTAGTLAIAEEFIISRRCKQDFISVKSENYWTGQELRTLLTHVDLANYTRQLVNWKFDDHVYRDFVLSAVITGNDEELDWRRPLWSYFYPRIQKEHSILSAVEIIVRRLRQQISIVEGDLPDGVISIWARQMSDELGFQVIYVAAMRAAGIPARLRADGRAEFWDSGSWYVAPAPLVTSWESIARLR